jgi:catechol 2,3-dioxygenase-like lactoylglutathione lyase family enzyme
LQYGLKILKDLASFTNHYLVPKYQTEDFIQIQTPNTRDIIVLEKSDSPGSKTGGIIHFGFRLKNPIDEAVLASHVTAAGGLIKEKGAFVPGEPYVFLLDPDGYEIEIWYENIPPDLIDFS